MYRVLGFFLLSMILGCIPSSNKLAEEIVRQGSSVAKKKMETDAQKKAIQSRGEETKVRAEADVVREQTRADASIVREQIRAETDQHRTESHKEETKIRAEADMNREQTRSDTTLAREQLRAETELSREQIRADTEIRKAQLRAYSEIMRAEIGANVSKIESLTILEKAKIRTTADMVTARTLTTADIEIARLESLVGALAIRQSAKTEQERINAEKDIEFAIAQASMYVSDSQRLAITSIAKAETEKEIIRAGATITALRLLKEENRR